LWSVVATHGRRARAPAPATRSDGWSLRTRGRDARSRCPRSTDHPHRRLRRNLLIVATVGGPERRGPGRRLGAVRRDGVRLAGTAASSRRCPRRGVRFDRARRPRRYQHSCCFGRKRGRPRPQFGSVLLLRAAETHQPRRVPTRNPQLGDGNRIWALGELSSGPWVPDLRSLTLARPGHETLVSRASIASALARAERDTDLGLARDRQSKCAQVG
jgi:hypothetical protein